MTAQTRILRGNKRVALNTIKEGESVWLTYAKTPRGVLAEMIRVHGKPIRILIDGGVDPSNIRELYTLGARDLVSGGGLFYHRPLAPRLKEFREAMG